MQEYSIRVPKNVKKRYHVMRFNAALGVEFSKWTAVKMERENNQKEFKGIEEEIPKYIVKYAFFSFYIGFDL